MFDLERGFLILDRESSKNRTTYKWPLSGDLGDLIRFQVAQIALEERKLRRVIAWLFHRDGRPIPYGTLYDAWCEAAKAAGFPGKLMHDFRRTAARRLDSTPGILRSVAITLLGQKTDIMFCRYIQTHDERFVDAANALAKRRASEMVYGFRRQNGTKSVAERPSTALREEEICRKINNLEEERARWLYRSSKPAWQLLRLPEGSTPSPLRHSDFRFEFLQSRQVYDSHDQPQRSATAFFWSCRDSCPGGRSRRSATTTLMLSRPMNHT
jgi:hypothetical protein